MEKDIQAAVEALNNIVAERYGGDQSKIKAADIVDWYDAWRAVIGEAGVQEAYMIVVEGKQNE
ncbi:MAG: hypothetical protein GTO24_21070 [candidate division Zixibacteria bacterium]|nr:hypothetical protein [candidate division Zixibacteria bacterium]